MAFVFVFTENYNVQCVSDRTALWYHGIIMTLRHQDGIKTASRRYEDGIRRHQDGMKTVSGRHYDIMASLDHGIITALWDHDDASWDYYGIMGSKRTAWRHCDIVALLWHYRITRCIITMGNGFLDAPSHQMSMRPRIFIRGCVRRSVRRSVGRSLTTG